MTRTEPNPGTLGRRLAACALIAAMLLPAAALAQSRGNQPALLAPPNAPLTSPTPGRGSPGATLVPNSVAVPSAQAPLPAPTQVVPMVPAGHVALAVVARYGRDAAPINAGLIWRVYADKPDQTGIFRLIAEERTAAPIFVLPAGGYVVHASLGLASASKPVRLRSETVREVFEIAAGAVRIEGKVGDARIPASQISFDLFKGSQFEPGERRATAQNVMTGDVVLVPEGVYSIVSNYGDGNAVVRSDIRVQAGKLTDVSVTHRAAVITLKLVSEAGGEALANTAWTVLTPGGDVIKESIGAFPRVILAEGEYRAIARNENRSYEREFKVLTGVDGEVEVLAR
jgi:hypothetical protein